jgi:hypothetical protein
MHVIGIQGLSGCFWTSTLGFNQSDMRWSPLAVAKMLLDALLVTPTAPSAIVQQNSLYATLCAVLEGVLVSAQESHKLASVLLRLATITAGGLHKCLRVKCREAMVTTSRIT